jgi:uncharacterized membrane protein YeiH
MTNSRILIFIVLDKYIQHAIFFLKESGVFEIEMLVMYGLDLFGTFIFAITGAVRGVRRKFDFLGVMVLACTVGVGGGIFRDLLLGATPVAAYRDPNYLFVSLCAGLAVFIGAPKIVGRWRIIIFCDAIGLGVFTAIGAAKGMQYEVNSIGIILSGVFSAVGGGVVRDIMSKTIPAVLTSDFYATASLLGGIAFLLLNKTHLSLFLILILTALMVTSIRLLAIHFNVHLPVAKSWNVLAENPDPSSSLDGAGKKK